MAPDNGDSTYTISFMVDGERNVYKDSAGFSRQLCMLRPILEAKGILINPESRKSIVYSVRNSHNGYVVADEEYDIRLEPRSQHQKVSLREFMGKGAFLHVESVFIGGLEPVVSAHIKLEGEEYPVLEDGVLI